MADKNGTFPTREERVPYGGGKAPQEHRRQSARAKKQPRQAAKKRGKRLNRKPLYLIGILLVLLVIFFCVRKNGSAVFVADTQVGILKGHDVTAEELTQTLETQLQGIVGSKVQINEEIRIEGVHINSKNEKEVCTLEHLLPKLRNLVTYKVDAAVIMVNGGKTAVLANQEAAEAVLEQVRTDLLPEEGISEDAEISWVENVEITNEFVESTEILEKEDAVSILESTTQTTQSYTVQSGDALYLIAQEFQTTVEKLIEVNTGTNLTAGIKVGQVINVPVQKPKISVKSVEIQVLTAVEPKTYQTQYDDSKPSSYQKVIQQGKAGQKKSTIRITRVNGVVTEEEEVSKEIITEAVPEIILKGTQ